VFEGFEMNAYLYPVSTALIQFPILAIILTIPYMVVCFRKYGSVSVLRSVILFSFFLYLQCAYYLVILPLPDPASIAADGRSYVQFIPFSFILDFARHSCFRLYHPGTWLPALKEVYVLQPLFNIALLIPFGVYLAYYFNRSLKQAALFSFLLSLFFELTQLTGLYWIYARPYRLFDVDDLMLNTAGGIIGALLAGPLTGFLPGRDRIDRDSRVRAQQVSYTRRIFAVFCDFSLYTFLTLTASNILRTRIGTEDLPEPVYQAVNFAVMLLYFVLQPALCGGKTLGKRLVRIKLARRGSEKSLFLPLALRYTARHLQFTTLTLLNGAVAKVAARSLVGNTGGIYTVLLLLGELLIIVLSIVDFYRSFRRGKLLWYERLSGTANVSAIKP
jgi:glycopeptide antibiotics resistance protein